MANDLLNVLQQIDPDKPFGDEDEKRLEKTRKEKTRRENREKRLNDCGKWSNWYNPHSGKRTGFIFKCGLFRQCNVCLERRADEEYDWIKKAAIDKRMIVMKVDSKKATNLIRKAEKTEYIRYPGEDGQDVLFLSESLGIEGDAVDLNWVVRQDWKSIVNTPEGRNKSGTMHVPVSDEEEQEFTIINTQQFITTANRNVTLTAMREAEEETAGLNPKTAEAVVRGLRKRINIATRKLRQAGYSVNVYNKKLKLVHSMVNWHGDSGDVGISGTNETGHINRLYTENPTRANMPGSGDGIPIVMPDVIQAVSAQSN